MAMSLWLPLALQAAVALTPERALVNRRIGTLVPSGDGAAVAFTVSDVLEGTSSTQHIYVLDVASGDIRQFTSSAGSEWAPVWSPDRSRLAFLSDRAGPPQIYVIPSLGGEAQRLFENKAGVEQFAWSPDGSRIAYLAGADPTEDDEAKAKVKDDAKLVDRPDRESGIWIYDTRTEKSVRITGPRWRIDEFVWLPSADRLVVAATDTPHLDQWTNRILTIGVADTTPVELVRPVGPFGALQLSADGRRLGYLASREGGPIPHDLMVWSFESRTVTNVTRDLDLPVDRYQWRPDGTLLLLLSRGFGSVAYTVAANGTTAEIVDLPVVTTDLAAAGGALVGVAGNTRQGTEVWTRTAAGQAAARRSRFNAARDSLDPVGLETFTYRSFDRTPIEGGLLLPRHRTPGARLPLIVLVHGGPTGAWNDSYETWGQLLAARGYAVFYPNIRGSVGYGWKFLTSNRGDWGGGDFKDLMIGVDTLIGRGIADPARLGIGGWSYGGYMASWAITQTDRFKAAITGAGMSDLAVEYGTEAGPQYDEWFYGLPYEKPDGFKKSSPMTYITRVKTPTLILQGEQDLTDPISQSQLLYRALKRYRVPTELVLYPREGHGIREERHQIDRLKRVVAWFDRWLRPQGSN